MTMAPIALRPLGRADLDRPLAQRFLQVVAAHAIRPAIVDAGGTLSYGGLSDLAAQYANVIAARVAEGQPVALCMATNRHVPAAMLGALLAGRPYVTLDPGFPAEHLARVIGHSGAKLVIGHSPEDLAPLGDLGGTGVVALTVADIAQAPVSFDGSARCESPAYILYTSGSTGAPKGVWQDQRGLLHDVMQYTQAARISPRDRHSLLYSPSVNGALRDIYGSLLNGATLCVSDLRREGLSRVLNDLTARQVTVLHAMPPVLRSLIRVSTGPLCPDARLLYTAGDRFLTQDLLGLRDRLPQGCEIYTGIGSTECATLYRQWIVPADWQPSSELVPVGYPVADREMRLVDDAGEDVAAGEVGQIVVSSRYVARGYWNDNELSARAFATVPGRPGCRRFMPGDLGRMRPDGLLEFLGRADRQIKIRGYRIEPAEIEAALRRIPGVAEAAIVPERDGDQTRLFAFAEAEEGASLDAAMLKEELKQVLPSHLCPHRVIVLDRFPRLGNFKLDMTSLKAILPGGQTAPAVQSDLPADYMRLWEQALKREVDPDSTLEEIGADSLELLELEFLVERGMQISLRGAFLPEASPRSIWGQGIPAAPVSLSVAPAGGETLHALAALMASSKGEALDPDGLVRAYNRQGTRMPLLWCFNQVHEAEALAASLGPDQPLIAMRSLAGLYQGDKPDAPIERQVAERYIQIVLEQELPQRVAVGGNCQAVNFAFLMANALAMAGHAAASLIFLEKMMPVPYGGRMLILFGRDSRSHNPTFHFEQPTGAWGNYLRNARSETIDGAHGQFFSPGKVGSLASALRGEIDMAGREAVAWLPAAARRAGVWARILSPEDGRIAVRVGNPGQVPWAAGAQSKIAIAVHWLEAGEDERPLRVPDLTLPLPQPVAAGSEIELIVTLPPDRIGAGRMLLSLCEEGVGWFDTAPGSETLLQVRDPG